MLRSFSHVQDGTSDVEPPDGSKMEAGCKADCVDRQSVRSAFVVEFFRIMLLALVLPPVLLLIDELRAD